MSAVLGKITRLAAVAAILALTAGAAAAADRTVRVGYQKYGTFLLLKASGLLEKKLEPLGFGVAWTEFPGGPQLLEALNVGDLDFGITGEAPPVFAQAAGAPLLYVAAEPPAPAGEAILVPQRQPDARRRRAPGQAGRAQQGLERAFPAGAGAGVGGPRLRRRSSPSISPRRTRAPRSSRARSTPGRSGTRSRPRREADTRGAHRWPTAKGSRPTGSSISAREASPTANRRGCQAHAGLDQGDRRLGRRQCRPGGQPAQPGVAHSGADPEAAALEPPILGRRADHAAECGRRPAANRRHVLRARLIPQADQDRRRRADGGVVSARCSPTVRCTRRAAEPFAAPLAWLVVRPAALLVAGRSPATPAGSPRACCPSPPAIARVRTTWRERRTDPERRNQLRARAQGLGDRRALGFALGVLNGVCWRRRRLLDSTLQMLRNIPHLAIIPIVILWFGIGEPAKIFLVAVGVFFPIYLNTYHGVRTGRRRPDRDGARLPARGVSAMFWRVILPGALPSILRRRALRARHHVADADRRRDHLGLLGHRLHDDERARIPADRRRAGRRACIYALLGKLADVIGQKMERAALSWHPSFANAGRGALRFSRRPFRPRRSRRRP